MTITITTEKLIKEIQEEFNTLFPFLRIEFFIKLSHKSKELGNKISDLITLGNAYNIKKSINIEISPWTTVRDFKSDFAKKFGLYATLYRKSGNLWQAITITDNWTMKQQDRTGNEISTIVNKSFSSY